MSKISMDDKSEDLCSKNFITENVSNIKKLQKHVKTVMQQKAEQELKRTYGKRAFHRLCNSKSRYANTTKQKGNKKKEKNFLPRRAASPVLLECEEPITIIETVKEVTFEEKPQLDKSEYVNLPNKTRTVKYKNTSVNVRDIGCQYGDPKRTFFFEDGSNINVFIPSKHKVTNNLVVIDSKKKSPFVVPSRYLALKNKPMDKNKLEKDLKTEHSVPNTKHKSKVKDDRYKENIQGDFRQQHEISETKMKSIIKQDRKYQHGDYK